ncbi:MAG: hypothetical protein JWN04_617 [Myxococcaceae bacterium]|nr:hypothetical protein [Myxococcaceae bacterium]
MSKLLFQSRALSIVFAVAAAAGCSDDVTELGPQQVLRSNAPADVLPIVHTQTQAADAGAPDATLPVATNPFSDAEAAVDATVTSDAGPHGDGDGDGDAGGPAYVADGTFASVYAVLSTSCISCHGAAKSIDLSTPERAYATLVNVPASMKACAATDGGVAWLRVLPGDLEQSLMIQKLEGHAPCGNPMPIKALLPDAEVEVFRAWVMDGAPAPLSSL